MPYKIVQTIEGKKKKLMTCPSGWEEDFILKYPKRGLSTYLHDENSKPEANWDVMMCIVKRSNISSYDEGEKIITDMMNQSDTDENDNFGQKRHKSQAALNLNIIADQIVKPRRPSKNPSTLCLNNMAETMMENVIYLENPENPFGKAAVTSATFIPENVYVPIETNSLPTQETISIDIGDHVLENQRQILENHKQLMDSNTAILGKAEALIKVQGNVLQKLSSLSVQLEDAVMQITEMRNTDNEVQLLKDSKGPENTPFSIKAIDSPKEMDVLEINLTNNNYRNNLKQAYSIVCSKGAKGIDCAYALVDIMFTRKFITQCSWSGGSRGNDLKVPLKAYKQVMSFFWELVHFWDGTFTLKNNEMFFKMVLKNANKRKLAKCERASTSRSRSQTRQSKRRRETNTSTNLENTSQGTEVEKEQHIENEEQSAADEPESTNIENQNEDIELENVTLVTEKEIRESAMC